MSIKLRLRFHFIFAVGLTGPSPTGPRRWNPNSRSAHPLISGHFLLLEPSPLRSHPQTPQHPTGDGDGARRFSWRCRRCAYRRRSHHRPCYVPATPPSPLRYAPFSAHSALPVRPLLHGGRDQIVVALNIRAPYPAPPPPPSLARQHPADAAPTRAACRHRRLRTPATRVPPRPRASRPCPSHGASRPPGFWYGSLPLCLPPKIFT
jgi:hypothetical protein